VNTFLRLLEIAQIERLKKFIWGLVLLSIPVTTFPFLPTPLGRSVVAPLALLPLALLLTLLSITFYKNQLIDLPENIRPLLFFLFVVLVASLFGLLDPPLSLRGVSYFDRVLRGWFSLLLGLVFYFTAFWMNRSKKDLWFSLRWIYLGLGFTLLWSLIQAVAINTSWIPRNVVNQLQQMFSTRPLLPRRISGFAYEPAWLADQIVIFYLPWLVASLIALRSLTEKKWLEPLLLVLSVAVLIFTYSRGGLLTGALCLVSVSILFGKSTMKRTWDWVALPVRNLKKQELISMVIRLAILAILVLSGITACYYLLQYGYFARVLEIGEAENMLDYVIDIGGGPRLAYAFAGYKLFEAKPLMGTGLGASGLALLQNYPDWSANLPEVARQLSPDSSLIPNIKNLYIRLLAETGLTGFWAYLVFTLSFLVAIRKLSVSRDKELRFVAIAGAFAWLAISVRNLTQDSFTFPVMWIMLGMLMGLYSSHRRRIRL
jgi:hypothetical protein